MKNVSQTPLLRPVLLLSRAAVRAAVLFTARAASWAAVLLLAGSLTGAVHTAASQNLRFADFHQEDERRLLQYLTLEEKIGQILIFGFEGRTLDEDYSYWLESGALGNVKLFLRNVDSVDQVRELTELVSSTAARSPGGIPPFIATDFEGGIVNHLRPTDLLNPPAAGLIGATRDPAFSAAVGRYVALNLHNLGINMNFAPCVDILTNMENQVIGTRSFSSNPHMVYRLAAAFLREQKKLGIVSVVKHFPGHGMTDFDSHLYSQGIDLSREELEQVHLYPYARLIEDGLIDGCMGTHVIYNNIDPFYPATFSRPIMEDLLRDQLGFEGISITDDLEMEGSTSYSTDIVKAFILAFRGGNDLILVSHTKEHQERVLQAAVRAFEIGALRESDLDERVLRILRVKRRYLMRFYVRQGSELVREYARANAEELVKQQVNRGVVLMSSRVNQPIPGYMKNLKQKGVKGLVLSPTWMFARQAARHLPGWDIIDIDYFPEYTPNRELLYRTKEKFGQYDVILLGMGTIRQRPWAWACRASGVPYFILSINNPGLAASYAGRSLFTATCFEPYHPALQALFTSVFATGAFAPGLPY
jgi:beta-N-acetylhexosaminidase